MQKLSVREFKNLCDQKSNRKFIFDSVNQNWCKVGETMKIKLEFDNFVISFNPNTVRLRSPAGEVVFERVRYIEECEPSLLGDVFNIVCGFARAKSYTIIVA